MAHKEAQKEEADKDAACSSAWFDWASKGEDSPYPPVYGGLECNDFLGISQQCWESVATAVLALLALLYAYPRLRLPGACSCGYQRQEPAGKGILLLLLCLAFGIEVGVKLATRRMFWIGKPGHLATMLQIFILAAPPNRIVTAAFRLQMHMLVGIPLVVFFPITSMHLSLFESGINFIQHLLMLGITFYLMHYGDPYIPESLGDFSWAFMAYVFLFVYHFLPLQLLAYVSQVNLNNILYPDSLEGNQSKFYRLMVFCHQLILIPTFGKLLVIIANTFRILPCSNPLDASEECTTCCKLKLHCKCSCCSADTWKRGSASGSGDDCNTDEDSGCVHSWSMLNKGCRRCSSRNTRSTYCSGYRPSCHRFCPQRSCMNDHKEFTWGCSLDSVPTRCIVNGKLVDGVKMDEASCKRSSGDKSSNTQRKSPPPGNGKSSVCRSFLLDDMLDSSPEGSVARTVPASEHDPSRSYVKSH
ncbi:unnamed protein product [Candidula unifasciata]|uniref:Uncharacterized protein n=1 Tax=Candidula unifasciata TaxID=100452 RepID=A0A8S3ZYR0_9EUPU|nr:unnamed protein product [Candidula unifasciata]